MWVAETDDTYVHRSVLGPVYISLYVLRMSAPVGEYDNLSSRCLQLCPSLPHCIRVPAISIYTFAPLPFTFTPHAHTHSYLFCAPAPSASQDDDAAVLQILNSPFPTPPSLLQIPKSLVSTPVFLHSGPWPCFLHPSPIHFPAATGGQSSGRVHATEGKRLSRWVAVSHRANFHGIMVVLGLVRMIYTRRCTQNY